MTGDVLKRIILILALFAAIAVSAALLGPAPVSAAGFRIGPYVWFAWWMPSFEDWMLRNSLSRVKLPRERRDFVFKPSLMYGTAFTIDFTPTVNLTSVFTVGHYRMIASVKENLPLGGVILSHPDVGIYKYDLDTFVNVMAGKLVRLFGGIKYQRYTYQKADLLSMPGILVYADDKVIYHGLSVGFGAGFIFRLTRNLHVAWNNSLLYQRPIIIMKKRYSYQVSPLPSPVFREKLIPVFNAAGMNTSMTLAYRIDPAFTTLSLGFRYQYLHTFGNSKNEIELNRKSDHFYGITMAAIYSYQSRGDSGQD